MTICTSLSKSIFYWRGCLDPEKLLKNEEITAKVLEVLSNRCTRGTNLKKLNNHNIYRIKTNDKGRILFADYEKDGKHYMLLLDYLPHHKYQKSKFLNPKILEKFRTKEYDVDAATVEWEGVAQENLPHFCESSRTGLTLNPVDYYKSSFISFNDFQGTALKEQLPLLVSGPPGSGKSCVALSSITNYLSDSVNHYAKRIVYVCFSERLAKTMEKYWKELPLSEKLETTEVLFMSYDTLLKKTIPELKDCTRVTEQEVDAWLHKKKVCDPKSTIEEFQILSSHTKEEYLNLGARQCLYHTPEEKENICKLFEKYKEWLREENKYDIRFVKIDQQSMYDLMVVDEAQDLSLLALLSLFNLAEGQISYFMDTQQDLEDSLSKRSLLKQLMYTHNIEINTKKLPTVYRCPSSVLRFANLCLGIKAYLVGGVADKEEYREILLENDESRKEGKVLWCTEKFQNIYTDLRHTYKETEIAIITEDKSDEIFKDFKEYQLFTAEEIKGLEFPGIIIYKPFESPTFRQINANLKDVGTDDLQGCRHRAKKSVDTKSKSAITRALSKIFTSITRAEDALVIYQPIGHQVKNLHRLLSTEDRETQVEEEETFSCTSSTVDSTREDWLDLAKKYLAAEQFDRFEEICRKELQADPKMIRREIEGEHLPLPITTAEHSSSDTAAVPLIKKKTRKSRKKASDPAPKKSGVLTELNVAQIPQKTKSSYSKEQKDTICKYITYRDLDKLKQCLIKGYDINFIIIDTSPLILALSTERVDIIQLLLDHGADIDFQDTNGKTAIFVAAATKNGAILQFLLGKEPKTPFAKAQRRYQCASALLNAIFKNDIPIAMILMNSGIRINHVDTKSESHLMTAAKFGRVIIADQLIENGAIVNAQLDSGHTALIIAIDRGHTEMVKLLLNYGADPNLKLTTGETALMKAARNGYMDIVKLLIKHGAQVGSKGPKGITAIKLAAMNDEKEIVAVLIKALQQQSQ